MDSNGPLNPPNQRFSSTDMSASFFDNVPSGLPPPGVQSNLINPTTQKVPIIVLNAVFTFLMTITVLIRFYVRIFLTRSTGWDDYTCGFAAILSWLQAGLMINATFLGFGTHMWDIPASTLMSVNNMHWILSMTIVYPAAMMMIKASILLLYYRIFHVNEQLRRVIVGSIIFITLVHIPYTVLYIFTTMDCVSLSDLKTNPICNNNNYTIVLSLGVLTVVTDFWLLFLPMRSILGLQLEKRRKIGLVAVFGTAALTCVVSLTRTIYYSQTWVTADPLWTAALCSELSIIEVNAGIIVASSSSLPSFYTSTKAFMTSIYQSLVKRTPRLGSSEDMPKASSFGSDDRRETRTNKVGEHKNHSEESYASQQERSAYQFAQPILRTDSYEVTYHQQR